MYVACSLLTVLVLDDAVTVRSLAFANSEVYFDNTLSIPIYVGLTEKEQIYIFKNLIRIIKNNIKSKVNKK